MSYQQAADRRPRSQRKGKGKRAPPLTSFRLFKTPAAGVELVGLGRLGVAVRGGDCAGMSSEAEDRAAQWSKGAGRWLRAMLSFLSAGFGWGERGGDEGLRECATDMSQKGGIIVAK